MSTDAHTDGTAGDHSSSTAAGHPPARTAPTVTMIGGGQLSRMTAQAAVALGQTLRVLASQPGESAAQVTPDVVLGEHTDREAVARAASGSDVVTFDHEHVPQEILTELQSAGVNFQPPPSALLHAQDKLVMRQVLSDAGAPVPAFAAVTSPDDVVRFAADHPGGVVLKATRGGYDGKGVWMPADAYEAERIAADRLEAGVPLMVEAKVPWRRELSAVIARSPFGQGAVWPVVETVQENGICVEAVAPAPALDDTLRSAIHSSALRIAATLGVTGVMAVELFEVLGEDGQPGVLVNELAMRPHNSGHWTMDGAVTSQFEQHLRAVLDYPLGSTMQVAPVVVMSNVLGADQTPTMSMDERIHHLAARFPQAKVHLYGKSEKPGRKIGHVNVLSDPGTHADSPDDVNEVRVVARLASHWLSTATWLDGWDPHTGAQVGQFARGQAH